MTAHPGMVPPGGQQMAPYTPQGQQYPQGVSHLFRHTHLSKRVKLLFGQCTEFDMKECLCSETLDAKYCNIVAFILGLEWTSLFNSPCYIFFAVIISSLLLSLKTQYTYLAYYIGNFYLLV
jgi:hypothetical protein